MTSTLDRKDVRLLRPVILCATVLGAIFYLILPAVITVQWHRETTKRLQEEAAVAHRLPGVLSADEVVRSAAGIVASASGFMWVINLLLVTTVAGMAFAVERREGWSDLVAMLPVSRGISVREKSVTSAGVAVLILGANLVVMLAGIGVATRGVGFVSPQSNDWSKIVEVACYYLATIIGMAGVAWLMSSVLRSAVIATAAGVTVPVVVWSQVLLLQGYPSSRMPRDVEFIQHVVAASIFGIGVACFVAGTIVQLRRQSP